MRTLRRKRHTNANAIANDKNERKRNLAQDDDAETHWALPIIGTIVVILNLLLLLIIIFDIPILSLAFYFFNNLYPNSIKYDGQNDLTGGRNLFFKPNHKYTLPKCKECIDKKQEGWCDITLPTRSYFGFAPPTDKAKWKQAACLAASGDNVLFERIFTEIFPSKNKTSPVEKPSGPGDLSQFAYRDPSIPVDVYGFLDGDLEYHMLQPMVDIFMNKESSFNQLLRRPVGASSNDSFVNNPEGINLNEVISDLMVKLPPDEYEISPEELQRMRATLPPSNLLFKRRKQMSGKHSQNHINKYTGRYPIVSLGYPLLKRVASDLPSRAMSPVSRTLSKFNFDASTRKPGGGLSMSNTHVATETNPSSYYKGEEVGGYYIGRDKAMRMWSLNKDAIEVPFVAIYVNNENWGYLSTGIPGRTKDWEQEDEFFTKTLYEFLDHPMTLALVINQHHNFSHPKIINFPLGLPPIEVAGGVNGISSIVHEVMEEVYGKHEKKNTLVYTAYSRSGDKERIMKCLSKNIRPQEEHVWKESVSEDGSWRHADMSRHEYYKTLAKSRFTIGLPGSVGIDTFRNWEALSLGVILVAERGVGLDRLFSKLPVLLVDDFSYVTVELLKVAYVEAIYRVHDFQFEKLHQDFWWEFLRNITAPSSTGTPVSNAGTDYIFRANENSNRNTACGLIKNYFPMESEDNTFRRSHWEGYTNNDAFQNAHYQCKRFDLGGKMGPCFRFPNTIC